MNFIGIDPGLEGAVCILSRTGKIKRMVDMPVVKDKENNLWQFDSKLLYNVFITCKPGSVICIEKIESRPHQNVKATWTQARIVGGLDFLIHLFDFQIIYVEPKRWQLYYNKTKGSDKNESITIARSIFNYEFDRPDTAEAALIARYGKYHWKEET